MGHCSLEKVLTIFHFRIGRTAYFSEWQIRKRMKVSRSLCFQRLPREEHFYRHHTSSPALANFPSQRARVCREPAGACPCPCGPPAASGPHAGRPALLGSSNLSIFTTALQKVSVVTESQGEASTCGRSQSQGWRCDISLHRGHRRRPTTAILSLGTWLRCRPHVRDHTAGALPCVDTRVLGANRQVPWPFLLAALTSRCCRGCN